MKQSNLPNVQSERLPEDFTSDTVRSLRQLADLGRVRTDSETDQRIDDYFKWCQVSGCRPGVESLCLALGVSRQTLFRWVRGINCSSHRQESIERAKLFITSFLEQASLLGRLNPATSIFLLKNWADYKDQISFESVASQEKQVAVMAETREQIGSRYADAEKPELPDFEEFD